MPTFVSSSYHRGGRGRRSVGGARCDFAEQESLAVWPLRVGLAVAGRAAAVDVADEHVLALEADGLDDLVEELTGATDEGEARSVLVRAGGLADEQQARLAVAIRVHDLRAALVERATDALADVFAYVLEGLAGPTEAQLVLRLDLAEEVCIAPAGL